MFAHDRTKTIDPLGMSKADEKELTDLLSQRPLLRCFEKNFKYTCDRKKSLLAKHKKYIELTSSLIRVTTQAGESLAVIAREFELAEGVQAYLLHGYLHQEKNNRFSFQGLLHHYYILCDKPICLTKMSNKQSKFLFALIMQAKNADYPVYWFNRGRTHFYIKDGDHNYFTVNLNIDADILLRRRQSNLEELRLEISDNHASFLGGGAFGSVSQTCATLIPQSDGTLTLKPLKRVVKESKQCNEQNINSMMREIQYASLTPHMHPKPLVRQAGPQARLFMVSRYFSGMSLHYYLDVTDKMPVTPKLIAHLIDLSFCVLRCVQQQCHQENIIHCDVKPLNFILDMKNKKYPLLNLIDYGLSRDRRYLISQCGTSIYAAPEVWSANAGLRASENVDVYSMGVTLIRMWMILQSGRLYNEDNNRKYLANEAIQQELLTNMKKKYAGFKLLTESQCIRFVNIVYGMICEPPESRISLQEAINQMAEFRHLFYSCLYANNRSDLFFDYFELLRPAYINPAVLSRKISDLLQKNLSENCAELLSVCSKIFSDLKDDVRVVEHFVFMLGQCCLQTETTIAGIQAKIKTLSDNYYAAKIFQLKLLRELLDLSHEYYFKKLHAEYQVHLERLHQSCLNHSLLTPTSLDEMVKITEIYCRDIAKLQQDVDFLAQTPRDQWLNQNPVRPWREYYAPLTLGDLCRAAIAEVRLSSFSLL